MKIRGSKGITLIALIITIIVLLILAGVALATLTENNNIIENANKAVGTYNDKANEEQGILNELESKLREYTGGGSSTPTTPSDPSKDDSPTTPTVDENGLATAPTTIKPDQNNNLQIVIPTGFTPAILQTGTTQSLPGEDGSVKNKMPVSEWNNITATDINKGIVVVDGEGNEFVWIPIPDSSKFARKAWTTPYGYDTNGDEIDENSLQQLANTSTANRWWEDQTTDEYTQMVNSVKTNKGFYVARYEASANSDYSKIQSQRGANVFNNVTQTYAIKKSANNTTALHSHLIYGIEWDSILNWLNENAIIESSTKGERKTMETSDIQTNSSSWGNHSNSNGNASTNKGSIQNSGTSEYWKANNIYDLAGNVWEWTQEKWSTDAYRTDRGGGYLDNADDYPVASRIRNHGEYDHFDDVGFRVSFYL